MIRPGIIPIAAIFLAAFSGAVDARAAAGATPDFQEVHDLISSNLPDLGASQLNAAAVNGLLAELAPKVLLASAQAADTNSAQPVSKTFVFDNQIGYLRVARVTAGLATSLQNACRQLNNPSNKLTGLVVDLRFTGGGDYSAAAETADLFQSKKPATLDWGKGAQTVRTGPDPVSLPLVVLVNSQTEAAAEALAALLRESAAGLLLGNATAGHAWQTKDFPLSNGDTLRIAAGPVKLNDLALGQVTPDIKVKIEPKDERVFYADGFFVAAKTNTTVGNFAGTNNLAGAVSASRRPRLNEAELVRAHREGINPDDEDAILSSMPRDSRPEAPVVADPPLARALDLLKGLAVVRQNQP